MSNLIDPTLFTATLVIFGILIMVWIFTDPKVVLGLVSDTYSGYQRVSKDQKAGARAASVQSGDFLGDF